MNAQLKSTEDLLHDLTTKALNVAFRPTDLLLSVGRTTAAEAERRLVLATLDYCEGNKRLAARMLGLSLKTIYNKLYRYRSGELGRRLGL